ncbi:helix-turn-helix domain containing protein [Sphaerisporangium sp. TRM90804]|uniref:TetR/AcrR family transcriptional regulator n=1 Tax=Sphaerisporangium sp. TRM90804 TaxID=3031113 RepID=UPI00244B9244|nr:helix-turn-helix domain containing protein [Sphaerisporangium sp. TRM90804]MDH2426591.1 helix-turn-helix domain containing protein [Sphaerisporangium sp. TRM90804]
MSVEASRKTVPVRDAPGEAPSLRADARHNRNRIVDAARETFSELGLGVPMSEIARRAGVGAATLYRRFPTKEALVTEAFADQVAACAAVVHDAARDPDPWRGFCTVIERLCAMHAHDRAFTAAFLSAYPDNLDHEGERVRAEKVFADLARRAQEAGKLRPDFVPADLILLLMANAGIVTDTPHLTQAASRRFVAYQLQALRAATATPLPPSPPLTLHHIHRPPTG